LKGNSIEGRFFMAGNEQTILDGESNEKVYNNTLKQAFNFYKSGNLSEARSAAGGV
jgi:hypothetical protein